MYGRIAAATLGYIVGDVPGAYAASELYGRYSKYRGNSYPKSMKRKFPVKPNVPRKRFSFQQLKNKGLITSRRPAKWYRLHKLSRPGSRPKAKAVKAMRRKQTSRSQNVSVGLRKKSFRTLHKDHGLSKVKVSSALRKKVQKVIQGNDPKGYAQYIQCAKASSPAGSNQQFAGTILGRSVDGVQGNLFTPTQVNCAASVMWHKRTPSQTITYADADMFPWTQTKIKVLKQWATVKWRNNGQRTCIINMYAGINKTNRAAGSNLYNEWVGAMTEDATANVNVINNDPTTLYATPFLNKSVNNNWKIEQTKIYLKPGEEYTYSIEGPSKLYDYRKFWQGTTQWPFTKGSVSLMYTMYQDLVGDSVTSTNASRLANSANSGYGCIYEVNEYYQIEMPDQTGVLWATAGSGSTGAATLPADATLSYLGARRDAFFIKNFAPQGLNTNIARLDIENSVQGEAPPVG